MSVYDLWLPVVLSGIATHLLSTIAWMVSPHHKTEWTGTVVEEELINLLHQRQAAPGQYMFPFARDAQTMQSEEFRAREGKCRGMLILWDAPLNMGAAIGQTLAFFFVAAFTIGYLASLGLERGESFGRVFQFVTTAGLLAHCFGKFPHVFWFRRRIAMDLLDGVIFAVVTGLIFALWWPAGV